MSDQFELRLQRVLRADAERAVRPFDAAQLATDAAGAPVVRRQLDWRPAGWPAIRLLLIASLLLVAALATLWLLAGGAPKRPSLVEAVPSGAPSGPPPSAALAGSWIARPPADLVIDGTRMVDPFVFQIDSAGTQAYLPNGSDRERLLSSLTVVGPDELRLVTRPGPPEEVTVAGKPLGACATGDEGRYRVSRSEDGLLLTLQALADACPGRAAVLERPWFRYLGLPGTGGIGVLDGFDPLFAVTMPAGSWEPGRTPGEIGLRQAAPEQEFLAWKDPQGFNDPCDPLGKGRYAIENAAAFVAYYRQQAGFTVDSVTDLVMDGRPAINLKLHANPDAICPAGWLVEWSTAATSGEPYWYLRPGDSDSLFLVDLADTTLMFEMLAAPQDLDSQVMPTIRFLEDGLPASP